MRYLIHFIFMPVMLLRLFSVYVGVFLKNNNDYCHDYYTVIYVIHSAYSYLFLPPTPVSSRNNSDVVLRIFVSSCTVPSSWLHLVMAFALLLALLLDCEAAGSRPRDSYQPESDQMTRDSDQMTTADIARESFEIR